MSRPYGDDRFESRFVDTNVSKWSFIMLPEACAGFLSSFIYNSSINVKSKLVFILYNVFIGFLFGGYIWLY